MTFEGVTQGEYFSNAKLVGPSWLAIYSGKRSFYGLETLARSIRMVNWKPWWTLILEIYLSHCRKNIREDGKEVQIGPFSNLIL